MHFGFKSSHGIEDLGFIDDSDFEDDDWHSVETFDDVLADTDLASFAASWNNLVGRLIVQASGVRFQRLGFRAHDMWTVSFGEICELRKFHGSPRASDKVLAPLPGKEVDVADLKKNAMAWRKGKRAGSARSKHMLEIYCASGETYGVEILKELDEAFKWIGWFSGLRWQSLQPRLVRKKQKWSI